MNTSHTIAKGAVVIHASCGEGHTKAAQAIAEHLGISSYDLLDFAPTFFAALYSKGYQFTVKKFPYLWSLLFTAAKYTIVRALLALMHRFIFRSFIQYLKERCPSTIIVTHFFPIPLIVRMKKVFHCRLIVVVTDFTVHPLWINGAVDRYIVASASTKDELITKNIEAARIVVGGLPLRRGFYEELDRTTLKQAIIKSVKPALLVFSSSQGTIPYLKEMLTDLTKSFHLIIISGKNRKTKKLLRARNTPSVTVFEYYERIWELMEISDCIITKPGGLTVTEALTKSKPLVFTHYIPGQEKGNMEIAVRCGAGAYARTYVELKNALQRFCAQKSPVITEYLPQKNFFAALEESMT